jgi:hypothetical protein
MPRYAVALTEDEICELKGIIQHAQILLNKPL